MTPLAGLSRYGYISFQKSPPRYSVLRTNGTKRSWNDGRSTIRQVRLDREVVDRHAGRQREILQPPPRRVPGVGGEHVRSPRRVRGRVHAHDRVTATAAVAACRTAWPTGSTRHASDRGQQRERRPDRHDEAQRAMRRDAVETVEGEDPRQVDAVDGPDPWRIVPRVPGASSQAPCRPARARTAATRARWP